MINDQYWNTRSNSTTKYIFTKRWHEIIGKRISIASNIKVSKKNFNKINSIPFEKWNDPCAGYTHESWINHEEPPKYATLRSAAELARPVVPSPPPPAAPQELAAVVTGSSLHQPHPAPTTTPSSATSLSLPPRKSLSMCFTSTGTALSLPPKKKDIYRPYSLQPTSEIRTSAEEDLSAAQAILDLSASPAAPTHSVFIHTLSPPPPPPPPQQTAPGVAANGQLQPAQLQPPPPPPTAQPIPVSVLVPVPSSQTNQLRQQEQTPQPQSPATAETNATNCTGGRDGWDILLSQSKQSNLSGEMSFSFERKLLSFIILCK